MLICPYCGSENYQTVNSRNNNLNTLYVNRRKLCNNCNKRFTTVEITKELFDKFIEKEEKMQRELDKRDENKRKADNYEALKKYIQVIDKEGEGE